MKICSLYGAGFWYIPGTDTCIKLGGWVRTEYNINAGGSFSIQKSSNFTRGNNQNTIRNRGIMTWDIREQTEYGTLRAYIAGGWQNTPANGQSDYVANSIYAPRAFIQFAGFILGKAQSFYDFYVTPAYSNTTNVLGADSGGSGKIVWGYTAQFGGGLSASLALEDPSYTQNTGIVNNAYSTGPQIPDLVGNVHLDASWGMAQIMGALHQVNALGVVPNSVSAGSHPDDKVGWAVGAGATIKLDMIGKGDTISAEADYSQGAINYTGSGWGNYSWCHGGFSNHAGACGAGVASDATYLGVGNDLELTTAWSVVAGFQHIWNPHWKTSIYGTYGEISYNGTVDPLGHQKWNIAQIGSRTIWNPVKNLDLSVDVMYNHLGTAQISTCGNSNCSDQSVWQAILRAQRNFYP